MDGEAHRRPLGAGRGFLRVEDFCSTTGLGRAIVEALVTQGTLVGLTYGDGRVAGLFTDVLPTQEQLRAMGLAVSGDYDPVELQSNGDDGDDGDDGEEYELAEDHGPTWTMAWGEGDP